MTNTSNDKVFLSNGQELYDFEYAVAKMDEELREELHNKLAPCSNQAFFDAYVTAHAKKFSGEQFEV
jgi:3-phosphoglycerate kinase